MHLVDQKELRIFLAALGLDISQFETMVKPQPKQAEQPKQSGFEDMQEMLERVSKKLYAKPFPQGTSQTKEQAEFQQILNRLERLEQNERKQSSRPVQSQEDYVNALEDENEKLENELHRISKQYEITARKLAVQEEQNIKLFKTAQDASERESHKFQQLNGDARILAEQVHKLKEENADILKRYEKIYKNNIELRSINTDLENAIEKELKNKSNQSQSGIAMAKTSMELSRLVEENNELKQRLGDRTRQSIENSYRMSEEFKHLNDEIHNLKLEMNILGEENIGLIEKIEELENEIN